MDVTSMSSTFPPDFRPSRNNSRPGSDARNRLQSAPSWSSIAVIAVAWARLTCKHTEPIPTAHMA
ncbi:hypothetical protein EK904_008775 [Melospiza melodia maxima]|nr:hypothetical protein EK904_008775 [Melospiza melodia maxima]